jgi:putative phosphoribosyl transferase
MDGAAGRAFADRREAGARLAAAFRQRFRGDAVFLGLPRGGVMVADALARELARPIDVYIVRKLRAPMNPEFALGAVAEDGAAFVDGEIVGGLHIDEEFLQREEAGQRAEMARQVALYRGGRPITPLAGMQAVVVDDGIATGATVRAAVRGVRAHRPAEVLVAAPVASPAAVSVLRDEADDVCTVLTPRDFWAVGQYYSDFDQVTDEQVTAVVRNGPPSTAE